MLDQLIKFFAYDDWANSIALSLIESTNDPECLRLIAHILAAKEIWLARLNGQDSSQLQTFPSLSLEECRSLANDLSEAYSSKLAVWDESGLSEMVRYRNTKGVPFSSKVSDILFHVANHGTYHRGQMALLLRQNGQEAANTDLIAFSRL